MKTNKLSIQALVLGLSFTGLGVAATACGGANQSPKAATESAAEPDKGAEASCGASNCGEKKEEAQKEGSESTCGAGSCG